MRAAQLLKAASWVVLVGATVGAWAVIGVGVWAWVR